MKENYNTCFACGQTNRQGLKLSFELEDGIAIAHFLCPKHLEGYPGFMHGGIISTFLDEVMAKAILLGGIEAVTARMTTLYRNPIKTGMLILLKGWIESTRGKRINTRGMLISEEGTVLAEAEAVFITTGGNHA